LQNLEKRRRREFVIYKVDIHKELEQLDEKKSRLSRSSLDRAWLDKVMRELETMREETTVGNYQIKRILDNHEKIITKLETQKTRN